MWHNISFGYFFNLELTEGPIVKFLQSAGANAKQKKVQESMLKYGESAEKKDIFKPCFFL